MSKGSRRSESGAIARRLKEGRGQGSEKSYKPWLTVRDVPSRGLSVRIKGRKTGRVHHLLSQLELSYFLMLDDIRAGCVTDIREQFPLTPIETTLEIADMLSIRHPKDPKTGEPIVMTTDFLVIVTSADGERRLARTLKPSADLGSPRVIEKFEIERIYWETQGVDWGIVTEREIPQSLVGNLRSLQGCWDTDNLPAVAVPQIERIEAELHRALSDKSIPLFQAALDCDGRLGFENGTSLAVAKYLIATRRWDIDLHQPIKTEENLHILVRGHGSTGMAPEG